MTPTRAATGPTRATASTGPRGRGVARAVQAGPRVVLRYPTPSDCAEYLAVRLANRKFLEPWEGSPPDGSDPFGRESFARVLKSRRSEANHRFLICLATTGEIIGHISLGNIVRGCFLSCYTGYWLAKPHTGRGLMTEALGLALGHAFTVLDLHRVEANIIPTNRASLSLVKRCGMRYEGTAKRYLRINGRWRDHEHWAITAEEWRARPAPSPRR